MFMVPDPRWKDVWAEVREFDDEDIGKTYEFYLAVQRKKNGVTTLYSQTRHITEREYQMAPSTVFRVTFETLIEALDHHMYMTYA